MLTRTTLSLSNRSQVVRLPKAVASGVDQKEAMIIPDGARRIVVSVDAAWDDFFASSGI